MPTKRVLLLPLLALALSVSSQNIQLLYDFGHLMYGDLKERPQLTATFEMFHPDPWGSTYFFVDMDINGRGIQSGYTELARELTFWKLPVSIHLEYNGGLDNTMSFMNAYLGGATYSYHNVDSPCGVSFSAMYKYLQNHAQPNSFQLTLVWYYHFYRNMFTFSGYADFWREPRDWLGTEFIFMSDPQFWFNINALKGVNPKANLSIGTELKFSCNFLQKGFTFIPTAALKWTF